MRFGYVTPNSWGLEHPRQFIDLAVQAEELGIDSLWVSHHVLHRDFIKDRLGKRPYHDTLISLTAIAGATQRARIGTSVLVLPYLHPMPTAKALATIDHISGGRVDVGVGVGNLRAEHDAIAQIPFEQRGRYANEFLQVMLALWSGQSTSFDGEFFSFQDLESHPGPAHPGGLPLYIGGHTPAAMRRCARFATGWHGIGLEPEQVTSAWNDLRAALDASNRSSDSIPFHLRLHNPIEDLDIDNWRRRFDAYEASGVTEMVLAPQSGDLDMHRRWLDTLVPALTR
ncbi:TIGR03619 family F420-dependent LLM class oxidoreductase [Myxococcota bacterium]|nr:TIGR03619 family F420-dependent LLM class oxidoreductase [Myxococcota bacterium]